jgi:hypothetical protein
MAGVQFNHRDAAFLWCVPESGSDLECLIHLYVFIERIAIPSYDDVAGTLRRAVRAGIIAPPLTFFRLSVEWFSLFDQFDSMYSASELGMVEFSDIFIPREWPKVLDYEYTLSASEFRRAVDGVQKDLDRVFKK